MTFYPKIFTKSEQDSLFTLVKSIQKLKVFFDPNFEDIFGLSQKEYFEVLKNYPNWDLYDDAPTGSDDSWLAINNSFSWCMNGNEEDKAIIASALKLNSEQTLALFKKFKSV